MKLVFATNNNHKLLEIRSLLPEGYELLSLKDIGCTQDPPETQETMEGNAIEKARYIFNAYHIPCFADDSGLEVDALGGRPGVYSARFAGPEKNPVKNLNLLLEEMKGVQNRSARFKTVIAFDSGNDPVLFTGIVEGTILDSPQGSNGFGYDPVFKPTGYPISFAAMPLSEKNRISHRASAFALLINYLNR